METIILITYIIICIIFIHSLIVLKKERDYWYKLYNELLEENKETVFLNKRDVEKFGEIEILANKIIEERKNKYFGIGTSDIINAYNKACNMVKD